MSARAAAGDGFHQSSPDPVSILVTKVQFIQRISTDVPLPGTDASALVEWCDSDYVVNGTRV